MKDTTPATNAVNRETDSFMKQAGRRFGARFLGRAATGVRALLVCVSAAAAFFGATSIAKGSEQPGDAPRAAELAALDAASRSFEAAIARRDVAAALSHWRFSGDDERNEEEIALRTYFSSDRTVLALDAPALAATLLTATTTGTAVAISEPRGSVEQWVVGWTRGSDGWKVTSRAAFDPIDGLVHLELDPQGYVAAGQSIELEDFRLEMENGTLFLNNSLAGPTALVFVGKGRVTFSPPNETEKGQMRLFAGKDRFESKVETALVRVHPADLYKILKPGTFVDDPASASRLKRARQFFATHIDDAFVLEAPVEGSPWWVLPALGDAAVVFDAGKHGALTYTASGLEADAISFFNRDTRRQVSTYPRAGSPPPAEDADPVVDAASHDLRIQVNPETAALEGEDHIALDIRAPMTSFRLRLDDALRVLSVRSEEAGRHIFFRIRDQNTVLVSMGPLTGRVGRLNLRVRYAGRLEAGPVESEIIQTRVTTDSNDELPLILDPVLIYTRRRAFYPQVSEEDYATWTLRVTTPVGWTAVSSGERADEPAAEAAAPAQTRRTTRFTQGVPGKYIAVLISRLGPVIDPAPGPPAPRGSLDIFAQPRQRREAQRAREHARDIIPFYESLFGPNPYPDLRAAVVETLAPGGHSPPGFVILQVRPALAKGTLRDDPASFWDIPGFFLAHELAHQWWGQGVTPRSYRDRWLSESFAQYAAALWVRKTRGEDSFADVLKKMARWSRRMTDQGPVGLGNRVGHIRNDPQANRAIVYDKGAMVLDMSRRLMGDEAFARALTRFQADHRMKRVSTDALRRALAVENADVHAVFDQFVDRTALPEVHVEPRGAETRLTVSGYDGPLPVVVRVGTERRDIVIRNGLATIDAPAARVDVDPDSILLARVRRR